MRGGDGDIPTYSALGAAQRRERGVEGGFPGEPREVAEEREAASRMQVSEPCLFSWNRDPATGLMCVQSGL